MIDLEYRGQNSSYSTRPVIAELATLRTACSCNVQIAMLSGRIAAGRRTQPAAVVGPIKGEAVEKPHRCGQLADFTLVPRFAPRGAPSVWRAILAWSGLFSTASAVMR